MPDRGGASHPLIELTLARFRDLIGTGRRPAQLLLERGADPALKDNEGVTASAWATKNKRDDMAQMLREAEKKH